MDQTHNSERILGLESGKEKPLNSGVAGNKE